MEPSKHPRRNVFFLVLSLLCFIPILWWVPYSHLPPPGWAVALIAVAAAAMSVHDEMKGWQKAIWLIVIGAFLVMEIRAIKKDRNEQKETFGGIARHLRDSVEELRSFHHDFDTYIGSTPQPSSKKPVISKSSRSIAEFEITSVLSHGEGPPPARQILKLWVTVANPTRSAPALVNHFELSIKIPSVGVFTGHPTGPFTDDAHFESLESKIGNAAIRPGGEVQGNLMFLFEGLPVRLTDPNIEFTLTALVNGKLASKTQSISQIENH